MSLDRENNRGHDPISGTHCLRTGFVNVGSRAAHK